VGSRPLVRQGQSVPQPESGCKNFFGSQIFFLLGDKSDKARKKTHKKACVLVWLRYEE
jgi:hypothetical protein